jgi:hypothetical protein
MRRAKTPRGRSCGDQAVWPRAGEDPVTSAGEHARPSNGELLATRRAEAIALFEANQRGRSRASALLALGFLTILVAGTVGIASHASDLAIPVPTVLLLLAAELFQYYADVTVIGTARHRLESAINAELGAASLIYESLVADIRKRPPLVLSERVLQAAGAMVVLASIVVGAVVAYDGMPTWVEVAYPACTVTALAVAVLSYRAMLASVAVAAATLAALDEPPASLWTG